MPLQVQLHFDPSFEDLDGSGWVMTSWVDEDTSGPDGAPVLTTVRYTTATLAVNGAKAKFDADPEIDLYFQRKAEAQVLVTQAAAVTSAKNSLLTAEGLTL